MSAPQPRKVLSPWLILGLGALVIALLVGGAYAVNRPAPRATVLHLPEHIEKPVWMDTAPASLKELYAWSYQHPEELKYITCWCGCDPGHTNNFDCYWKRDEKGAVVAYEEHAYG
ncbi:MAG TPA: PCYCGC motif-containing (lipo)protein [Symbiobacteriaceae bacterium]|nr:PCYCGC motif-containing (lipo)protein [Symbiobacteriaceae bacterium]